MVKSAPGIQMQSLPPTSDAAKYHTYGVMYQAKSWMDEADELKPEEWGWEYIEGKLVPRTMDLTPAPACILKIVRCQCRGNCSSNRCTCRKNDLLCTNACSECMGVNCDNIDLRYNEIVDEDDAFE